MNRKTRRVVTVFGVLALVAVWLIMNPASYEKFFTKIENNGADFSAEAASAADPITPASAASTANPDAPLAIDILQKLEVKGRAPKTGYSRDEFYNGWPTVDGCNLRQKIIKREFATTAILNGCDVVSGEYDEPYTGEHKIFTEKSEISKGIQIDHVVALSDAWQKGAQYKTAEIRYSIATDPLNLLAVDSSANQKKSDGDAATWLPPNKKFRCQYVARQVSVKYKYDLWVTSAEKEAIEKVLTNCPHEPAIGV